MFRGCDARVSERTQSRGETRLQREIERHAEESRLIQLPAHSRRTEQLTAVFPLRRNISDHHKLAVQIALAAASQL
jgi:hypothetical protein